MTDERTSQIVRIICQIAETFRYPSPPRMLNERYLHHLFSHRLQDALGLLNLTKEGDTILLHPEWPTSKKATGIACGRYRRNEDGRYVIHTDGRAGFLDFAIGGYDAPRIGIELYFGYRWVPERIVFDILKLLDRKNPFGEIVLFALVLHEPDLPEERMNAVHAEAVRRLAEHDRLCGHAREQHLIITEIGSRTRRHWHYDRAVGHFVEGLPHTC